MNNESFERYTNKLLSHLTGTPESSWGTNATYLNKLKRVLSRVEDRDEIRQHRTEYSVKDGEDFRFPLSLSSVPYITDVSKPGKIGMITLEPEMYRFSSGSRLSNKMKAKRLAAFKKTIPGINKKVFSNGINLDSFTVLNVSDQPMQREHLHYLTKHGGIIPLDEKQGVFVPDFAMKNQSYYSIEYEGRFKLHNSLSFNSLMSDPVKLKSGFDPIDMLSHDAGNSTSYSVTTDGSIADRVGTAAKEIRIGAAPLSNLSFTMHHTLSAWSDNNIIRPKDRVMDKSAGMHISSTVPNLGNHITPASNYLKQVGTIIDALSRTRERWKSSSYLGIPSGNYSSSRYDFRMNSSTDRLEMRYPAIVADTAHITNQLIMASKLTSDLITVMKNTTSLPPGMSRNPDTHLRGVRDAEQRLTRPLQSNDPHMQEWFKKFMSSIGIDDEFNQDFIKNMNARCMKTSHSR